jgi:hypothetical protein
MAILTIDKAIHLAGRAGNLIFRRRGNKTIVASCPKRRKYPLSPAAEKVQKNFVQASAYAKAAQQDPVLREIYQDEKGMNTYRWAMKDALNKPEITRIDATAYKGRPGDLIRVSAHDDFNVVCVLLTIHEASGKLIETGNALPSENGEDWLYTATAHNKKLSGCIIRAAAFDLPENEGSLEVEL